MKNADLYERVKQFPWVFFHLPKELRTQELALLAWPQVRFVVSNMRIEDMPYGFIKNDIWVQFVELLCGREGSEIIAGLVWSDVVKIIDAAIKSKELAVNPYTGDDVDYSLGTGL